MSVLRDWDEDSWTKQLNVLNPFERFEPVQFELVQMVQVVQRGSKNAPVGRERFSVNLTLRRAP
jgi:hypothetical protein